jgi:Ca-activated chloride channel family protein
VRRHLGRDRVNRVILLSDGLANVGPDSPGALGELGASLRKEGISVTTIGLGLGYNEDLMARLARSSDGNHAFVESSDDLVRIFSAELEDILSVVAQNLVLRIRCPQGVRPLRVVGREADVMGSSVYLGMNQLYGNQEKYVLVELEVPEGSSGQSLEVASVELEYEEALSGSPGRLEGRAAVSYTSSARLAEERVDRKALASVIMQVAAQANQEAVALRDKGDVEEARALLEQNAELLLREARRLEAPELEAYGMSTAASAEGLDEEKWNAERKRMVSEQHAIETQQSY